MSKKPAPKGGAKPKVAPITVAQELHVDTDLRRLVEACGQLGEAFTPFMKRVRGELSRVKEGEQEGVPQVPLFVHEKVSYDDAKRLFETVLPPYPYLRVLQFHHSELGDDSVLALTGFLRSYKPAPELNPFAVETLELPGCAIGSRGAGYLGRVLSENRTITQLVLDFNPLGDAGAKAIADGLRWNGTLSHLSMQYCDIGAAGAGSVATGVVKGSNVTALSLRGNPLGAEGVKSIGQALGVGMRLSTLDLADTDFGASSEAVEVLCEGLETSSSLTTVNIDLNTLVPTAPQAVLTALRKNPSLVDVVVSERMDDEAYRELLDIVSDRRAKAAGGKKRKKSSNAKAGG